MEIKKPNKTKKHKQKDNLKIEGSFDDVLKASVPKKKKPKK
ncbi:hypothetical protein [Rasiella sp. SM2506]